MKKSLLFILIAILFIKRVDAKSIDDLYNELEALEAQKELYNYLSSDDIKKIIETSYNIEIVVDNLNDEINGINNDILVKENSVNELENQINKFLIFNQISNGENVYLEYIFDSDSYSDLVYRYMIVKQITEYSNNLIKKLNEEVNELEKKKKELNVKLENISTERENFKKLEYLLKNGSSNYENIGTTLEKDIVYLKNEISKYESLGCSRYSDLNFCLNIKDNTNLLYPLMYGCVTKNYVVSSNEIHKGIDLGCNKEGNYVYASGKGIIAEVVRESSCGGNIIWIYHKLNGREYTTIYAHLLDVKVNVGDIVDSNTIIGTVGGESTSILNGGYDECTNGAHLHYAVVEGYHTNDYNIYTLNPRYINYYPNVLNGYFRR